MMTFEEKFDYNSSIDARRPEWRIVKMDRISLDAATLEKLELVDNKAEVCDPSGRLVGYFVAPQRLSELERKDQLLFEMLSRPPSDEELAQSAKEPGVYSMDDVMKLLEKR